MFHPAALGGKCADGEAVVDGCADAADALVQVPPTKLTEWPSADPTLLRTSSMGLAIVAELFPAVRSPIG